jgi:hypothetical protein
MWGRRLRRRGGQFRLPAPQACAPVLGRGPDRPAAADRRPGGIEDYSHQINTASSHVERHRIGER